VHVNNVMKNYAVSVSTVRRWTYTVQIHHCMAAREQGLLKSRLRVPPGEETALASNAHDELADVL